MNIVVVIVLLTITLAVVDGHDVGILPDDTGHKSGLPFTYSSGYNAGLPLPSSEIVGLPTTFNEYNVYNPSFYSGYNRYDPPTYKGNALNLSRIQYGAYGLGYNLYGTGYNEFPSYLSRNIGLNKGYSSFSRPMFGSLFPNYRSRSYNKQFSSGYGKVFNYGTSPRFRNIYGPVYGRTYTSNYGNYPRSFNGRRLSLGSNGLGFGNSAAGYGYAPITGKGYPILNQGQRLLNIYGPSYGAGYGLPYGYSNPGYGAGALFSPMTNKGNPILNQGQRLLNIYGPSYGAGYGLPYGYSNPGYGAGALFSPMTNKGNPMLNQGQRLLNIYGPSYGAGYGLPYGYSNPGYGAGPSFSPITDKGYPIMNHGRGLLNIYGPSYGAGYGLPYSYSNPGHKKGFGNSMNWGNSGSFIERYQTGYNFPQTGYNFPQTGYNLPQTGYNFPPTENGKSYSTRFNTYPTSNINPPGQYEREGYAGYMPSYGLNTGLTYNPVPVYNPQLLVGQAPGDYFNKGNTFAQGNGYGPSYGQYGLASGLGIHPNHPDDEMNSYLPNIGVFGYGYGKPYAPFFGKGHSGPSPGYAGYSQLGAMGAGFVSPYNIHFG